MRSILTALVLSIQTLTAAAQPGCDYFPLVFKAETYAAQQQHDSAVVYYRQAFSIHIKSTSHLLTAAARALHTDSIDAAKDFLKYAFHNGLDWDSYKNFVLHSGQRKIDTVAFIPKKTWEDIFNNRPNAHNEQLVKHLAQLVAHDQQYREEPNFDEARMREADSLNALELRKIVGTLGRLPGYTDLGPDGLDDLELLFLHMNLSDLQYFMPFIIAQIRNGEYFDNEGIAYQIDRLAISSGDALYIDEQDQLEKGERMPFLTPYAAYSVMGYWYEARPDNGKLIEWPVYPQLGKSNANASRARLCLDTLEQARKRKPWIEQISFVEFLSLFGKR